MESEFPSLIRELQSVHNDIVCAGEACADSLDAIPRSAASQRAQSGALHWLCAATINGPAQMLLASHGLSSLGRTESHVRETLETVLHALHALDGSMSESRRHPAALTVEGGNALRIAHADALLGPPPRDRTVRVMVTMPAEAASDYVLVRDLLAAGMDCMRINCAHDGPATWEQIIDHLGRAKRELKRDCQICMDVAGPKLRTGPIEPGPAVLKIARPAPRQPWARHQTAVVAIGPSAHLQSVSVAVDAVLPIDGDLPSTLKSGSTIQFDDARGRSRRLMVPGPRWGHRDRRARADGLRALRNTPPVRRSHRS